MAKKATYTGPGGQRKAFTVGLQPAGWSMETTNPRLAGRGQVSTGAMNAGAAFPQTQDNSQADFIQQIVRSLYPQQAAPPSFETSGLWNEQDAVAQGEADFRPTFNIEQQRLQTQQQNATRGLGQQQAQDTGNQLSNYYNRGLSRSGAFQGAQQYLGQNQAYDTSNLQNQQGYDTNALGQQQKATLASTKASAYQNSFQRYLNQFRTQ